MKALSVQQPWGSLICCGLKDVENRKWALKNTPIRVLIHVGAKRQPITDDNMWYPDYWYVENYQKMGILPSLKKLPTSAVIGVATIDKCVADYNSMWSGDGPGAEYKWVMKDVKMFKEPILNVKGSLGIFNIPSIDENNLPECLEIPQIKRHYDELTIPVNKCIFNQIADCKINEFSLNVTNDNLILLSDAELNAIDTRKVIFTCGDDKLEVELAHYDVLPVVDEDDNIIIEEDAVGNKYEWWKAVMQFE